MVITVDLETITNLYETYSDDLRKVRESQRVEYERWASSDAATMRNQDGTMKGVSLIPKRIRPALAAVRYKVRAARSTANLDPTFPDICSEITYLLLRLTAPETVVEMSPAGGWSTMWILNALRDNRKGHLHSFDIIDDSTRTVPKELSSGRWSFTQGDVKKKLKSIPQKVDYLFMDSLHSAAFAEWYIRSIFPRLREGVVVSVDDIFDEFGDLSSYGEASVLMGWLGRHNVKWFGANPKHDREAYESITAVKRRLKLDQAIHPSTDNPAVFFTFPRSGSR